MKDNEISTLREELRDKEVFVQVIYYNANRIMISHVHRVLMRRRNSKGILK